MAAAPTLRPATLADASALAVLVDIAGEPKHILDMYGEDVHKPATFGHNCLLARRMAERGVRFIQIFHRGWDHHSRLPDNLRGQCRDVDQPSAALLQDLKQRGLLEDTLVVWCTEFGRMPTFQKGASGRDHNPSGFTTWLAGAGVKKGYSYGATDEFGYRAVEKIATVYDFHATILHLLGLDHRRLSFYQDRLAGIKKNCRQQGQAEQYMKFGSLGVRYPTGLHWFHFP